MELKFNEIFKEAIIAHKEGKYASAEKLYLKLLNFIPKHPELNNNLGIIKEIMGDYISTEKYNKITIKNKPNFYSAYNNLGVLFKKINIIHKKRNKLDI